MAQTLHDRVHEEGLTALRDEVTHMAICDGAPAALADAQTGGTNFLGEVAISAADFDAIADGDVSGRKLTFQAQTGISVANSGELNHFAFRDDANSRLLAVDEAESATNVSSGSTVDTDAWDLIEDRDP